MGGLPQRGTTRQRSTNAEGSLPKGKTRVATIHVQVTGEMDPDYAVELEAAWPGLYWKVLLPASSLFIQREAVCSTQEHANVSLPDLAGTI